MLKYKQCPKCRLNYITENETFCSSCVQKDEIYKTIRCGRQTDDFSCIISGRVYGTNTRKIYEKFCDTLGWDKGKANQFGWQTPLYAENCDTKRENDVWFICYPNYNKNRLDCVVDDFHVVNLIHSGGNEIIEIVDEKIGVSNNANRITFVKTKAGYEFLGVYALTKNGTTRVYERIRDEYPSN